MAVMVGLALTGAALRAVVKPVREARRGPQASPDFSSIKLVATHGLSFGVLGGFRAVAADLVWLKTYVAWEQRDAPATESLLQLATALDGRSIYFWLNGARMIAYDIPAWQYDDAQRLRSIHEVERTRIFESQAQRALLFLQRGMEVHSASSALWIERANIQLNCLRDVTSAAESYRRASQQPDAPYFPARIHAELLRRLGRESEALAWLTELYPNLPKHVESAAAELVLTRIRDLEHALSIAPEKRFSLFNSDSAAAVVRPLTQLEASR
jgi:hypothetical protein